MSFRVLLVFIIATLVPFLAACADIANIRQTDRGMAFTTASGSVELQAWSTDSIRVQIAPGKSIPAKTSLAVIDTSAPGPWKVRDDASSVGLTVGGLTASVDKKTERLTFSDADGKPLLQDAADEARFKPADDSARDGLRVSQSFVRDPAERFFGMGVVNDQLALRTASIPLFNGNTSIHVPVLYSSRGYGVLWDNASKGELDLTPDAVTWRSSAGDLIDYYVMAGPSADRVIAQYRALTGQAPLFPKWAYGFWFCKNRFRTQDEILQAAADFRAHQIPIDLLVQDYYYWQPNKPTFDGQNWGSHQFDPERYPDPRAMIAELHHKDHIHFMAVTWAKFDPATDHGKELAAIGGLFPPANDFAGKSIQYYDPFFSQARKIYGRQVMESLLPLGVDAFWIDGAEPEMDKAMYAADDSPAGPVSRFMNAFPLMHTTALYEAQRSATPDKRVVLLPRSAWAGMQRNGAANWTGDIHGDWKTLDWQICGLQNYSIAGLPYITTDIGGYSPTRESDEEHFLRWFEWGSFCPIFRVHGVNRAFPWQYGPEAEAIIKSFNDLHYRLLPYTYSNAANVTLHAGTMMRPLVMDFRGDPKAVQTWDQFMYGPAIMVCPVHQSRFERLAVSPDQFADLDGKAGGLSVTYIKTGNEKPLRQDMPETGSLGRPADFKSIQSARFEGSFTPKDSGPIFFRPAAAFGEGTLTIDGKTFTPRTAFEYIAVPINAKAGEPIHFSFETTDLQTIFEIVRERAGGRTRSVYLPAGSKWTDFWTGQVQEGGQTITADAPLDRIPLFVRGGSILPMGPQLQYAAEHPDDPIELRVYPGADGEFTLYEDEGDSYAYEKGAFATIPITWTDKTRTLTIGDRQGTFPGMLANRTFRIVWVEPNHGVGGGVVQAADVELKYIGKAISSVEATP